ncbi:hypothetical protein [Nonomuraea diastatica]|uniref:Uncharacterized protein n=1 Tax=Nonomuraea diastatica TaxID=1848329 RepID=A0A4R4WS40_9ACTN|nr:hypothetical protein [Nonomuraea diastatica]TDD20110.1 hypothetical protein E1294_18870 [Nonomuraea diastatica]
MRIDLLGPVERRIQRSMGVWDDWCSRGGRFGHERVVSLISRPMAEMFTFEARGLHEDAVDTPVLLQTMKRAATAVGWTLEEESDEDFRMRKEDLPAWVSRCGDDRLWEVGVMDCDLSWANSRPHRAGQSWLLELIRALLLAAPPYVAVTGWGEEFAFPEEPDASVPYTLSHVGSVTFLGERYLATHLPQLNRAALPVRFHRELAGGLLLVADDTLLRSDEDGHRDELRALLGLPPAPKPPSY